MHETDRLHSLTSHLSGMVEIRGIEATALSPHFAAAQGPSLVPRRPSVAFFQSNHVLTPACS
ncbi:hypothetical protein GCM10007157_09200 [Vreelandella hamiltonii]|uniref:Uncharacterized protein n=1 Tax=Vreelandella hamiltonii TaxID=502829 RepID=A0A8H9I0I8_9GAMM|nr:hypothetical protein GCM10007157_09200 [Halomonas hamiltonii]